MPSKQFAPSYSDKSLSPCQSKVHSLLTGGLSRFLHTGLRVTVPPDSALQQRGSHFQLLLDKAVVVAGHTELFLATINPRDKGGLSYGGGETSICRRRSAWQLDDMMGVVLLMIHPSSCKRTLTVLNTKEKRDKKDPRFQMPLWHAASDAIASVNEKAGQYRARLFVLFGAWGG